MKAAPSKRFSRLKLIEWWEQKKIAGSKVLVVGAGALGNEILKNCALIGVGNILIVDEDIIEESNLCRSVLFRESDIGKSKAKIAAQALRRIYNRCKVQFIKGNVITDVGLGAFRWADVVIGAVDNRQARVWINRCCFRLGRPWIDCGIERIEGIVRFFVPPGGACYECTMSETDWTLLQQRKSCSGLARGKDSLGKVPTTPTTASVIGGMAVQEALKYIHGLETLEGRGFVFNGMTHDSYVVEYQRKKDCFGHESSGRVVSLSKPSDRMTVDELLRRARRDLGRKAVIELNNEMISSLYCKKCERTVGKFMALEDLTQKDVRCRKCRRAMSFRAFRTICGDEYFLDRRVADIGIPAFDIIAARAASRILYYEFSKDAKKVLGPLR